ncbi:hypothetical protein [Rhabdochromatium marinum]|uniref:hypothetical protein n=1 Tax=Rhabdochromatium marinum TaxID=48729 RepID=UPI001906850E|nr:hypothetical protein [Rhabdochromatium marinum]MBK1650556.1 hypothetical protein [Rhabdochromatium marinum]
MNPNKLLQPTARFALAQRASAELVVSGKSKLMENAMKHLSIVTTIASALIYSTTALAFDAELIDVEYYKSGPDVKTGCAKEDYFLVRQIFDVKDANLKNLVFEQSNSNGGVDQYPVKWINDSGYIVHSFCASPNHKADRKSKFIDGETGEKSNILIYTTDCINADPKQEKPETLTKLN